MYLRYVDDWFLLVRKKKIMDDFVNIINNGHNSISFTMERENDNEHSFLDIQVNWEENRFLLSVYKTKTITGCYFNFQSNCRSKRKVSLNRILCHCAHKICSLELLLSEIKQIKLLFNKNGYLKELVNKMIHLHIWIWIKEDNRT